MAKSLADGDAVLVTFSGLFIVPVNLCSLTQCFLLPAIVMPLSFPEIWASWLVKLAHEPRGMPRGEGICTVMLCTVTNSHSKVSSSRKGFTWVFQYLQQVSSVWKQISELLGEVRSYLDVSTCLLRCKMHDSMVGLSWLVKDGPHNLYWSLLVCVKWNASGLELLNSRLTYAFCRLFIIHGKQNALKKRWNAYQIFRHVWGDLQHRWD